MAPAADGGLIVVGRSYDPNYPVPVEWGPGVDPAPQTHSFVMKLDAEGQRVFAADLTMENVLHVAIGAEGDVFVVGWTGPAMDTTEGVVQPEYAGGETDAAV